MSVRTKNVINKTFADSGAADLFFSERNSFGKTYQFIYQVETEPENVYYIDETVDNPILLTGSGGGGGIESIVAGDNITIDDTDPLNPIVSASSGGTPAGSNRSIQFNTSGAFDGGDDLTWDSERKRFYAGDITETQNHTYQILDDSGSLFYVNGLKNTVPASTTTPVFTGSGSDDILVTGSGYSGVGTTNYTITIDGTNKDFINFPTSSISGSGFTIGEIVTSSSGGSATIDAINLNSDNSYENLVLSSVTGTFLQFDVITGGTSSTTATLDADLAQQDTYTWTDGATTVSNVICKTPGSTRISYDVLVTFDTGTGHTLTDNWTFDGVPAVTTYGKMLNLDGQSATMVMGDVDTIGNGTKITIDDVNEQITISNLSAYDDDTAAGVGGLTAGMVYMTTGSGSAPLNAAGILMIKQ